MSNLIYLLPALACPMMMVIAMMVMMRSSSHRRASQDDASAPADQIASLRAEIQELRAAQSDHGQWTRP